MDLLKPTGNHRHSLFCTGLIALLVLFALPIQADSSAPRWSPGSESVLPAPMGNVLLVMSGNLERPNVSDEVHLDLDLLEQFPQASFTTHTPWASGIQQFHGVWLHHLLEAAGSTSTSLHLIGYDDYTADLTLEAELASKTLIAYLHNNKPMSVRQLGPLRVIFPFNDHPELDTSSNHASAVWQLTGIELR